jgi:pyruvate carboxylase
VTGELKRKLNERIEFVAASHPARFDAEQLATEVLAVLTFPEQSVILKAALVEAAGAWISARIAHAKPEQIPLPDFPHIPPLIRVGRQHAVAFEHATAAELEPYYQKLKSKVAAQEAELESSIERSVQALTEEMRQALATAKAELAEIREIRKVLKAAARTKPDITVGELLRRRKLRSGSSADTAS